jgi:hypothetical protein
VWIKVDGTLLSSANMTFNAVAICGINARDSELDDVLIQQNSIGVGRWNQLWTSGVTAGLTAGSYVDLLFMMDDTTSVTDDLIIYAYFNRAPSQTGKSIKIGQIMLGTCVDLEDDPNEGLQTPLERITSKHSSEGGGHSWIARPGISEPWGAAFRGVDATQLSNLKEIVLKSKGGARPVVFTTHRHTGDLAWTDWRALGYTTGDAKWFGGGFFGNFDEQSLPVSDVSIGVYDVDFPVRRSLSDTESVP